MASFAGNLLRMGQALTWSILNATSAWEPEAAKGRKAGKTFWSGGKGRYRAARSCRRSGREVRMRKQRRNGTMHSPALKSGGAQSSSLTGAILGWRRYVLLWNPVLIRCTMAGCKSS